MREGTFFRRYLPDDFKEKLPLLKNLFAGGAFCVVQFFQ